MLRAFLEVSIMRRALSFVAAAVVMLVSATGAAAPDAGATDAGDSGISTMPSKNNPTIPLDSGTEDAGTSTASTDDGGGCSVVSSSSSEGWSTVLGLFAAASILVVSRRRRGRR